MYWIFLGCATLGGTIMVFQFVTMLIGIGGDDSDLAHDGDLGAGESGDFHGEHDLGGHDEGGDHADHADHDAEHGHHHAGDWLFKMLSFRTIVAALAFFGLTGLAAHAARQSAPTQIVLAGVAGWGALYGTYMLMKSLRRLHQDGTFRIERTVGATGAVYLPIPAANGGIGKVQLQAHGRLVELKAVTQESEKLRTGAKIVVVDVISHDTVQVELVRDSASNSAKKAGAV